MPPVLSVSLLSLSRCLVSVSFPNSVWERRCAKLRFPSRGAHAEPGGAKRSFADTRSRTEFGNENETTGSFSLSPCLLVFLSRHNPPDPPSFAGRCVSYARTGLAPRGPFLAVFAQEPVPRPPHGCNNRASRERGGPRRQPHQQAFRIPKGGLGWGRV